MLKSELIQKLSDLYPNILQKDLKKAVYLFFNEIAEALSNNSRCELRHFGTFKIKNMKARIGRNPKTGIQVIIKEKKIPSFKMSKILGTKINQGL